MRSGLRTSLSIASLCAVAVVASTIGSQQAVAAELSVSTVKSQVFSQAAASIKAMTVKSSATDTQFMAQGRFRFAGVNCPRCELGPAVAAAALYRRTGDAAMLKTATTVMDTAIATQQQRDGSFSKGTVSEGGNTIQTVFFTQDLGAIIYYLGPTLDSARRATYKRALAKAADALLADGLLNYYINGNVNLATTVGLGMTWKLTGQAKYKASYEKSLAFTLRPKGARWAAFGYQATRKGTLSQGRNSAGYLAEKGVGGTGFDPGYTQFQSDIAAQGYQVLGDARLLTLLNQLQNQLMPRVNKSTWALNVSNGSRHTAAGAYDRFFSAGFLISTISSRGQNSALAQVQANTELMRQSASNGWAGGYHAWAVTFATQIFGL